MASDDDYTPLLREFIAQQSAWARVGAFVEAELKFLTKKLHTPALVSHRTKEPHSLVLKAYNRGRSDPDSFHDKVAARVALFYFDDVELTADAMLDHFNCPGGIEDKGELLGTELLGYRGVHCDALLQPDNAMGDLSKLADRQLWCEIQVHTAASALWAATGHPLSYKTAVEPDIESKRAVNRLSAVAEVYDSELLRVRDRIRAMPEYPAGRVLVALEREYYGLVGYREHDPETSRAIVEALLPAYNDVELADIETILESFVRDQSEQIHFIYDAPNLLERHIALLLQPEALLVFERLEHDQPRLRAAWNDTGFPIKWYEDLAGAWGNYA